MQLDAFGRMVLREQINFVFTGLDFHDFHFPEATFPEAKAA